jgi:hypothetical protein
MTPVLSEGVADLLGDSTETKADCFFHLLGIDVMLDSAGKAHLLEVSLSFQLASTTKSFLT